MKVNPQNANRLTENKKNVIAWAFNLVHSIVVGEYNLPKPMYYAMNNLQDAVWELAKDRHISITNGCSKDYLGFNDGYKAGVKEKLGDRA